MLLRLVIFCILFGCVSVRSIALDEKNALDDKEDKNGKEIRLLIKRLGNRNFNQRNDAGNKLILAGELALPYLSAVDEFESDPEIIFRVKEIINAIIRRSKFSNSTSMSFALINVGEFSMGSPESEKDRHSSELQHQVKMTKYYLLGTKEVTQKEFASVMGLRPSWFSKTGKGKTKVEKFDTEEFPVDSVSWFDAIIFCNKLSDKDGLPKFYVITDIEKEGNTITKAKVKISGGIGYRLPTEAEWEYACRAGTSTPYHFGARGHGGNFQYVESIGYGRSRSKSLGRTAKGGSFKPNAWGLYDMHGNVAEWCWDWYSQTYYALSPEADPPGPRSGVLSYKVLRGGSFLVKQSSSRSATRFYTVPRSNQYYVGFRVARNLSKHVVDALKDKWE